MFKQRMEELIRLDKTQKDDHERMALFTVIAGNDELWKLRNQIYNFQECCIEPDVLDTGICTSSKCLIQIGFNMYNGFDTKDPLYLLSTLDKENFELAIKAIRVRLSMELTLKVL